MKGIPSAIYSTMSFDQISDVIPGEIILGDIIDRLLEPTVPVFGPGCNEERALMRKTLGALFLTCTTIAEHLQSKRLEMSVFFPIEKVVDSRRFERSKIIRKSLVENRTFNKQRHGKRRSQVDSYQFVGTDEDYHSVADMADKLELPAKEDDNCGKWLHTRIKKLKYCYGELLEKSTQTSNKDREINWLDDYSRNLRIDLELHETGMSHIHVTETDFTEGGRKWAVTLTNLQGDSVTSNLYDQNYAKRLMAVRSCLCAKFLDKLVKGCEEIEFLELKREVRKAMKY